MKCNHCDKDITSEEVKCHGCNRNYHHDCSISERTLKGMSRANKLNWRCAKCRDNKNAATQRSEIREIDLDIDNEVEKLDVELNPAIKQFLEKISKSVQFMSDKMDELNSSIKQISKENKDLRDEVKYLRQVIENKDKQIEILSTRISKLEQHKRRKVIEIHGVEEDKKLTHEEKFTKIMEKIKCFNIEYKYVTQVSLKNSNLLLVKFKNENDKETALKNGRLWWRSLTEEEKKKEKRLYFNDNLSPENRVLYRETRKKGYALQYRYVWVKNGRILVKKEDNVKPISINTFSDLEKYVI